MSYTAVETNVRTSSVQMTVKTKSMDTHTVACINYAGLEPEDVPTALPWPAWKHARWEHREL